MNTWENEPIEKDLPSVKGTIKELEELDMCLKVDDYKSWSYARLAVQNAIKLIGSYENRTICHCLKPQFFEKESGLKCCKNCGRS